MFRRDLLFGTNSARNSLPKTEARAREENWDNGPKSLDQMAVSQCKTYKKKVTQKKDCAKPVIIRWSMEKVEQRINEP